MSHTVKLPTCPKCGLPIPQEAPQGLCPKCVLLVAATATEQGVPATATSEIPSIERISKAFPQLEILELIGRGGMGFVFKARQPHLDRFVALKLLPDKLAKDAQFAERFNREGRVLAKLNHPNIVSVFDFGQTGGFYYLTMEYVDGVNLRQAMRAGRFSPAEALSIVPKVCEALQYAHEQGILHRDIKPENILLDAKGRVKIADFGIAKLVGEDQPNITLTNTGAALGTPHYMAPEQLEKPATVDHRADIYSLGVVFYEMLTGELPIGRFAAPSSKTPVNTTVDDVVFRTLEKDRERRFQSAGEMRTQVEHLGATAGNFEPSAAGESIEGERRYSHWSIYGAIAVGLSLPVPFAAIIALLTGRGGIGPGELWLALGSVALPGLGGTLLGWLALNEIRESGGRVKGLPLAMFATLFWPLTILGALTIGVPMFLVVPSGEPSASHTIGRFLVLLLPAAVIAFGFWAIHATARWAGSQQVTRQRGVLKWVFIVVLVVGMGVVLVTNRQNESRRAVISAESAAVGLKETAPMIQFTFTSVELREEQGARWLAMDYNEQVRGDCQHTFRYDARVPGFTAQTRMDAGLTDAKAGFAPVLRQRVLWKLPDSLPQSDALALRDLVAKEWIGKPTAIEPDDERVLFKTLVPDGGTLTTTVGVKRTSDGVLKAEVARQIQFAGPDQYGLSLFLHTDSELRNGDYLITLLKHPDGRVDQTPAGNYAIRQNGKAVTTKSFSWPMARFESNRVTDIAAKIRGEIDGTVVFIKPHEPLEIFTATNDRGGVIQGSIELRTEASDKTGFSFSVLSTHTWPQMLIAYLKVSGSLGYVLQGIGLYGSGVEVDTHTSISRDGAGNSSCRWNLPPGFTKAEADEIALQLEATKNSAPNGLRIEPGQRVPVFALTNHAGTVFRGYFELSDLNEMK